MELHSLHRELAMAQRHNFAIVAFGRNLERRRKRTSLDDERVVSASFERRRQTRKKRASVMPDHGCFPMHQAGSADHISAVRFGDALMSEANAQDGNFGAEALDDFFADARFARRARPRRNTDMLRR